MTYTSYFERMNAIQTVDPNAVFIAICGGIPSWYDGKWYKKVAPKWTWWKYWHDTYVGHYETKEAIDYYTACYKNTVLDVLDKHVIANDIRTLAQDNNAYLLCFETPDKFCHRHLLADWLDESLGYKINEWDECKS